MNQLFGLQHRSRVSSRVYSNSGQSGHLLSFVIFDWELGHFAHYI